MAEASKELFYLPEEMPPERAPVEDIYKQKLKDRINPPYRLQMQLERCNVLASRGERYVFESAVNTLIGDLPFNVKTKVLERVAEECTITPPVRWHYLENLGVRMGTIDDPVMSNSPEDLDYDPNVKSVILSPLKVQDRPFVDYEGVLGVIKEELEFAGGSWRYDKALKEMGKEPTNLPADVKNELIEAIMGVYLKHREEGVTYSWADFLNNMRNEQPRIPLFIKSEEEEKVAEE